MKEATGELNMTVITVVAIAAVGLLFTMFVWPTIQSSILLNSSCSNVDMNGNFTSTSDDSSVECKNFMCTANYNGKNYEKDCKA